MSEEQKEKIKTSNSKENNLENEGFDNQTIMLKKRPLPPRQRSSKARQRIDTVNRSKSLGSRVSFAQINIPMFRAEEFSLKTTTFENNKKLRQFEILKSLFFREKCYETKGIFRISPNNLYLERALKICERDGIYTPPPESQHLIAALVKFWITNMGFKEQRHKKIKQILKISPRNDVKIFSSLKLDQISENYFYENFDNVIYKLPLEKKHILYSMLDLLNKVTRRKEINEMNAKNLSIIIAPIIFNIKEFFNDQKCVTEAFEITENLIENFPMFIKRNKSKKNNYFNFIKNSSFIQENANSTRKSLSE